MLRDARFFVRHLSPSRSRKRILLSAVLMHRPSNYIARCAPVAGQQPRVGRRRGGNRGGRRTPRFFAKRAEQLLAYPPNAEKVFPTPRGFLRRWRLAAIAKQEGAAQREGVDLSCQTLAPRGGAPSLPPRPAARAPRCPIEIAGFRVVSLRSAPSFLVTTTLPSRPLAYPPFVPRSFTYLPSLASTLSTGPREPPAA